MIYVLEKYLLCASNVQRNEKKNDGETENIFKHTKLFHLIYVVIMLWE